MLRTAESVAIGHPDKVCDQISDAILDACLEQDPYTRSAIEVLGGHGIITICGELTTNAYVDMRKIAQDVYKTCGYKQKIGVQVNVVEQSNEIKRGVDSDGAGDQGIMVGYACNDNSAFIPQELFLARALTNLMGATDGKSQVTVDEKGNIKTIITSVCGKYPEQLNKLLKMYEDQGIQVVRNPNGPWTIGGFDADTGLTGRKLAVDNYGPNIPLGGGCFSGKDATKVDRSAAYMARKIAVDYLKKYKAKTVMVHLAYAIGIAEPVMATALVNGEKSISITEYDLRPQAIIQSLELRKPQFYQLAAYGHFGNESKWDRPEVI